MRMNHPALAAVTGLLFVLLVVLSVNLLPYDEAGANDSLTGRKSGWTVEPGEPQERAQEQEEEQEEEEWDEEEEGDDLFFILLF